VSEEIPNENQMKSAGFEILRLRKEGTVLFVEIAAPPMNLLGPELVRDLVSLIQQTGNPPGGGGSIHRYLSADFGAKEATILSKRGSPRSGSQKGSSFNAP